MIILPEQVNRAIEILENSGYDAYIVGACVRELLIGNDPQDYDIVTNAGINDILYAFREQRISDEGMARGEILVTIVGMIIQISPYRREVVGNRVMYAEDLETDLFRRGFSMNAMAYSPRCGLIDPFGGRSCLSGEVRRIVAVGENVTVSSPKGGKKNEEVQATYYDMSRCFTSQPARLLSAIRYCAEDEYEIEEQTRIAMRQNVSCFDYADKNDIRSELTRIVMGKFAARVLEEYSDILKCVLPEIAPCIGCEQHSPYHDFDVWTHIARSVGYALPDPVIRYAMLFHDLGKPDCMYLDSKGRGHFKGHGERGRLLAEGIMRRLEFERDMSEQISWLVYHHDKEIPEERRLLKGLINDLGADDLRSLIQCEIADARAKKTDSEAGQVHSLRDALNALNEIIDNGECYNITQMAVSKRDLIERRLVRNDREADELMNVLFEIVLDKPSFNNRLMLLDMAERSKAKLEQIAAEREQRRREQEELEKLAKERRNGRRSEPIFTKRRTDK